MDKAKTILVTGASKGIGKSIAIEAAKVGYNIVIHYGTDQAGAAATLAEVVKFGVEGRIISCDIRDKVQCKKIIEDDILQYGVYYGVVLNAGITRDNPFPALEDDDWDQVIHTNLDSFYNILKPIVMPMISQRAGGRIITLASVSGMIGNRGQVNYSASKAGIIGATKALAIELAKRNITVNCVAPGAIATQMLATAPVEEIKKLIPLQRLGKVEEVAATVIFLLSSGAAYITRQVIAVNGGLI